MTDLRSFHHGWCAYYGRKDGAGDRRHRRYRQSHRHRPGRARCPGRHHRPRSARAERAAADIRAAAGNATVDVFVADMSAQVEVRRLAAEVLQTYPRLDVLVNNVG